RSGVQRGVWCLFQMGSDENIKPDEFYSKETGDLPLNLDLSRDYSLVNPNGARQRGWTPEAGPDRAKVKDYVRQSLTDRQVASVMEIRETVASKYGDIPHKIINEAVSDLVKGEKAMAFKGKVGQDNKPDQLLSGTKAAFFTPESDDIIITPAKASEKGWIDQPSKTFSLNGRAGARVIMPLLRRISPLYNLHHLPQALHRCLGAGYLDRIWRLRRCPADSYCRGRGAGKIRSAQAQSGG
ncbi:MAG: hypothetical protein U9N19_10080, partial [Thermodesulfobacteriota bacterium]|nr:hypothetical protein [Thermodesulfobacteriota bacterium]